MIPLAVKYRPTTFDDVVGQDVTTVILKYQLVSNSIKNAYLFTGGAGTGKTTCAKIFANELNSSNGCTIEIDAASNTGVDNIRTLIEHAQKRPIESKYKIFILDECHALSSNAWQSLLKIVEEPPEYCIFIFCTTDPQKIPNTILSRVQRFNFNRVATDDIVGRLKYILDSEGISTYNTDALYHIARVADGCMREAITLVDQCLAYSTDLNMDNISKVLQLPKYEVMIDLIKAVYDKSVSGIISFVNTVADSGTNLKVFMQEMLSFVLDLCAIYLEGGYKTVRVSEDVKLKLKGFPVPYDTLVDMINPILECVNTVGINKDIIISNLILFSLKGE